jgi:hypothetical protein
VGLGPGFNLNGCAGCHAFPAVGGSSPVVNPQVAMARLDGAQNVVPPFITLNGPVREARLIATLTEHRTAESMACSSSAGAPTR